MIFNKELFEFKEKKENKKENYTDYYFIITNPCVKQQLLEENPEMCALGIQDLIYCYPEDEIVAQFVFPFNLSYYTIKNNKIKEILKEILKEKGELE